MAQDGAELERGQDHLTHGKLSTQESDLLGRDPGSITTERLLQAMGFSWKAEGKTSHVESSSP